MQPYSSILAYVIAFSSEKFQNSNSPFACDKMITRVLHLAYLFCPIFSSQILSSPLPPVSSPPPASKSKEVSDGENLEVSKQLSTIKVQEVLSIDRIFCVAV